MAKNRLFEDGRYLTGAATHPALPLSGDPARIGQIVGVSQNDERTNDGLTVIDTQGVYALSVKGVDGGGNSAVADGDILYYVDADTPVLSKKATGIRAGYARGTVASGATTTIPVKLGW